MKIMKSGFMCASLVAGVAASAAVLAGDKVLQGPPSNPDDQFRFMWDASYSVVPDLAQKGFNAFINGPDLPWDVVHAKARCEEQAWAAGLRKKLDDYQSLGVGFILRMRYGWDKPSMEAFARVRRDGSKQPKHIDASVPAYLDSVREAVRTQTRLVGDHPALIGVLVDSEMRGFVEPSFTPENAAAYRAFSGKEVPQATNGRNPVHWSRREDFPKDRIAPDDDNLLTFYRWQWRAGDGWTGYLDMVSDAFRENCTHPVLTMYDPALRCLSQWRNIGPGISHINHWTYPYPEPYRVGYDIAELQATARGIPGQKVFAMVQAISYRSVTSPIGEEPPNMPAWAKEFAACKYPTTAPDIMQEAIWTVFSHRVDGIGIHGWDALYDNGKPHATYQSYMCTNPETVRRIGKIFGEVGVPLGPLFKAVPERAPQVAVLESCAAQVLGASIVYSCHRYFNDVIFVADAANLSPYVMYDDEIKAAGIPASVKTLILPRAEVLTRSEYEAVLAFRARGGRVVADSTLLPALKADATFPLLKQEEKNLLGDFDDGVVRKAQNAEFRDRTVKSVAAKLKAACAVNLYVDSDNADILVRARTWRGADYVFAINSKRMAGDYMGPWHRLLDKGLPNAGTVTVRRSAGAVYDLVKHMAVPFTVKNGVTEIPVSYDTNDGRVFMAVDRPLSPLVLTRKGSRISVTSPDREAMIPIRIDGLGAKPLYAVVKDGRWSRDFEGVDKASVTVMNLADGRSVSADSTMGLAGTN